MTSTGTRPAFLGIGLLLIALIAVGFGWALYAWRPLVTPEEMEEAVAAYSGLRAPEPRDCVPSQEPGSCLDDPAPFRDDPCGEALVSYRRGVLLRSTSPVAWGYGDEPAEPEGPPVLPLFPPEFEAGEPRPEVRAIADACAREVREFALSCAPSDCGVFGRMPGDFAASERPGRDALTLAALAAAHVSRDVWNPTEELVEFPLDLEPERAAEADLGGPEAVIRRTHQSLVLILRVIALLRDARRGTAPLLLGARDELLLWAAFATLLVHDQPEEVLYEPRVQLREQRRRSPITRYALERELRERYAELATGGGGSDLEIVVLSELLVEVHAKCGPEEPLETCVAKLDRTPESEPPRWIAEYLGARHVRPWRRYQTREALLQDVDAALEDHRVSDGALRVGEALLLLADRRREGECPSPGETIELDPAGQVTVQAHPGAGFIVSDEASEVRMRFLCPSPAGPVRIPSP